MLNMLCMSDLYLVRVPGLDGLLAMAPVARYLAVLLYVYYNTMDIETRLANL
jgi:hypothetical protein